MSIWVFFFILDISNPKTFFSNQELNLNKTEHPFKSVSNEKFAQQEKKLGEKTKETRQKLIKKTITKTRRARRGRSKKEQCEQREHHQPYKVTENIKQH
jgi:hypothetical protein